LPIFLGGDEEIPWQQSCPKSEQRNFDDSLAFAFWNLILCLHSQEIERYVCEVVSVGGCARVTLGLDSGMSDVAAAISNSSTDFRFLIVRFICARIDVIGLVQQERISRRRIHRLEIRRV
jgi:hypothetical protein